MRIVYNDLIIVYKLILTGQQVLHLKVNLSTSRDENHAGFETQGRRN